MERVRSGEFKAVEGFPNYYVSRDGRVLSTWGKEPRVMSVSKNSSGYYSVNLYFSLDVRKSELAHRLVAKAFIPNPRGVDVVNHIDGVKTNNHVGNLEWVTHKENTDHAVIAGLFKSAYNNIAIYDIKEKKTIVMNTLARATEFLGINIENLIANFSEIKPLQDRYIIKFNDKEMEKLNDPDTYRRTGREGKLIYYYDYLTAEQHGPYMQRYAIYKTKVDATSIRVMMKKYGTGIYYKAGYLFSYDPLEESDVAKYMSADHLKDREKFLTRSQYVETKRSSEVIRVFDFIKNKEMQFSNSKEFSKATGIPVNTISKHLYALKSRGSKVIFMGSLAVTRSDIAWSDIDLFKVINALTGKYARGKLFIDSKTNTIIGQLPDLMLLYGEDKTTSKFIMDLISSKGLEAVKEHLDKRNGYKDIELGLLTCKATKENIDKWLPEIEKIGLVDI